MYLRVCGVVTADLVTNLCVDQLSKFREASIKCLFSSRLCGVCVRVIVYCFVVVTKYELSGNAMCANSGQSRRGDEGVDVSLEGDALSAGCRDAVGATRRVEAKNISPDRYWTLSAYRRKCRGVMDVCRFNAMAVGG